MQVLFNRDSLTFCKKVISSFIALTFLTSLILAPAGAQVLPIINSPASLTVGFQPPILLGLKIHPENPLLFDFIVDQGQSKLSIEELKEETTKLVKYFLAALTIPDKEVWVNLSPTEKDRIIPDVLGQTTMGKTMLEQDYVLKQLAASLTNPETDLGKKYWDQVNGSTNHQRLITNPQPLATNNFNKVWIMPAKAEVLESNGIVLVGEKRLKVMLAEEYEQKEMLDAGRLTLEKNSTTSVQPQATNPQPRTPNHQPPTSNLSSEIFRTTILPTIEKAVNEGKDFADVRQIYNSVILAAWYKKALKESLLGKIYTDKGKVAGVETDDKQMKQRIYEQYLAAFKKGAYNLIKEEADESGELIPRKYFSGGIQIVEGSSVAGWKDFDLKITPINDEGIERVLQEGGPILPFIVRILTEAEGPALGAVAAAQAQAPKSFVVNINPRVLTGNQLIDEIKSGDLKVNIEGEAEKENGEISALEVEYFASSHELVRSKNVTIISARNINSDDAAINIKGIGWVKAKDIDRITLVASSTINIKMAFVAALTAVSLAAQAVTPAFVTTYMHQQAFVGNVISKEVAKSELNVGLDEILNSYAAQNKGELVADAQNFPNLKRVLSTAGKNVTFDGVAKLTSEALKNTKDPVQKAALDYELGQWFHDVLSKSTVADKEGSERMKQAVQAKRQLSPKESPNNWRNIVYKGKNGRVIICENSAQFYVVAIADLRGIDDGTYSVVTVIQDFDGNVMGEIGHVAVLYNPLTGFGKPRFIDLAMTKTLTTVDSKGKVIKEERLPIDHKVIKAANNNGFIFTITVASDKSNLKGFKGMTATDLTVYIQSQNQIRQLAQKYADLQKNIESFTAPQVKDKMLEMIRGVVGMQDALKNNPFIAEQPDIKNNLARFALVLAENLQAVESATGVAQFSDQKQKLMEEALAGFNEVNQSFQLADKFYKEGNFAKAEKQFNETVQKSQNLLRKILDPKFAGINPGETQLAAEITQGGKKVQRPLGMGAIIAPVFQMYLNALNNARLSSADKLRANIKTSAISEYETRTVAVLESGVPPTASSALDRAQLVGKTFNVQKKIVHAVSLLRGGDSVTVTHKHFDGSKEITESPKGSIIEINGQTIGKKDRVIDGTTIVRVKVPSLEEDAYDIKGFTVQNILSITIDSLAASASGGVIGQGFYFIVESLENKKVRKTVMSVVGPEGDEYFLPNLERAQLAEKTVKYTDLTRESIIDALKKKGIIVTIPKFTLDGMSIIADEIDGLTYQEMIAANNPHAITDAWKAKADEIIGVAKLAVDTRLGEEFNGIDKFFDQEGWKVFADINRDNIMYDPQTGEAVGLIDPIAVLPPDGYKIKKVPSRPSSSPASREKGDFTKGGIDFDPTNMNLQIKRDGKGVPLPLPQQNLEQINIQGLFPVIINITPINAQTLPIFLGQAPKEPAREPELAASTAG